jgi:hypothetical protein
MRGLQQLLHPDSERTNLLAARVPVARTGRRRGYVGQREDAGQWLQ